MTKDLEPETEVKPVYLFDEQKNAGKEPEETLIYVCGACSAKSEEKFTKCKGCGTENEF